MKLLGEFYREKVLSQKKLNLVELPRTRDFDDKISIEPMLFGFRVHSEREFIEVNTEVEARYLKVFLEVGLREVMIPADLGYLESILPELEDLKRRHDGHINGRMKWLMRRDQRRQLHYMVWSDLMWKEYEEGDESETGGGRRKRRRRSGDSPDDDANSEREVSR